MRKTLASRHASSGDSVSDIILPFFKFFVRSAEIVGGEVLPRKPKGMGQAWWNGLYAE